MRYTILSEVGKGSLYEGKDGAPVHVEVGKLVYIKMDPFDAHTIGRSVVMTRHQFKQLCAIGLED